MSWKTSPKEQDIPKPGSSQWKRTNPNTELLKRLTLLVALTCVIMLKMQMREHSDSDDFNTRWSILTRMHQYCLAFPISERRREGARVRERFFCIYLASPVAGPTCDDDILNSLFWWHFGVLMLLWCDRLAAQYLPKLVAGVWLSWHFRSAVCHRRRAWQDHRVIRKSGYNYWELHLRLVTKIGDKIDNGCLFIVSLLLKTWRSHVIYRCRTSTG